jgi:hypothetical protein
VLQLKDLEKAYSVETPFAEEHRGWGYPPHSCKSIKTKALQNGLPEVIEKKSDVQRGISSKMGIVDRWKLKVESQRLKAGRKDPN